MDTLLDRLPDGVIRLDVDRRITDANAAAASTAGSVVPAVTYTASTGRPAASASDSTLEPSTTNAPSASRALRRPKRRRSRWTF